MTKEKRQTLNTEKRKVIGGVFQDHFESKSKYKAQHTDAIKLTMICVQLLKQRLNNL